MIAKIKCATCSEEMGQIDKDIITPEDIAMYQQMMVCSQGHSAVQLEDQPEAAQS
jgi:hypothetical protein